MENPNGQRQFRRTLIVDDHPLFCDALSMTLRMVLGVETVTTVPDLAGAIRHVEDGFVPDIILLDLNLPDVSGLDGLIQLKVSAPDIPVVIVSSLTEVRIVRGAIRAGAAGYVPKHSQLETFQVAFTEIAKGNLYLPDNITLGPEGGGDTTPREDAMERLAQLTRQQMRILQLICAGKLNKQIAHELSIAENTVKTHVTAIMRKLGVQSRTQAVLIAQRTNYEAMLQDQ